jgi:hypothetical protein
MIGKAKQLSNMITFFKRGTIFEMFALKAIARFKSRFYRYIVPPSRRTLTAISKLPVSLGGLGLVYDYKQEDFERLPDIFWWAIKIICSLDKSSFKVRRILSSTFSNPVVQSDLKYLKDFVDQMETYPQMMGKTLKEFVEQFNSELVELKLTEPDSIIDFLRERKIISFTEFIKQLNRPFLFYNLMLGKREKYFNSLENRERIKRTWERLEALRAEVKTEVELKNDLRYILTASKIARQDYFVDLNMSSSAAIIATSLGSNLSEDDYFMYLCDGTIELIDIPIKEHILYNAPTLLVRALSSYPKVKGSIKDSKI